MDVLIHTGSISRHTVRLTLFAVASVLLHAVTIFSAGPFQLAGFGPGAGPGRFELRATLVPARQPETVDVTDAATEISVAPDGTRSAGRGEQDSSPTAPAARDASPREAPGLALPSPETWYTAREVDVRAEPLTPVSLGYPERLRGTLAGGTVHLRLYIDERGVVRKMQIAAAEPPGLFEEAARSAWQEVRFKPAMKDGAPVKSQKLIEVLYRPD